MVVCAFQVQVPFDTYFKVDAINEYHRAITMEEFMEKLAPKVWPVGKRAGKFLTKTTRWIRELETEWENRTAEKTQWSVHFITKDIGAERFSIIH